MIPKAESYDSKKIEANKNELPKELEGIGITEQLGKKLPQNLKFKDQNGNVHTLGSFFKNDLPVVLSLVYFNCPSLCNFHLNGIMETLGKIDLVPGKDYRMIAISFDPNETPKDAKRKYQSFADSFENLNEEGIFFLTGDADSIRQVTETVGFKYKWEKETKQWAHASAAVTMTPDGEMSRYLHGIVFDQNTTRLSIVEASQGKIGDIVDKIVLFCFNYNPKENKYAVVAFNVMRLGGGMMLLIVALWVVPFWLRQRRLRRSYSNRAIEGVR